MSEGYVWARVAKFCKHSEKAKLVASGHGHAVNCMYSIVKHDSNNALTISMISSCYCQETLMHLGTWSGQ